MWSFGASFAGSDPIGFAWKSLVLAAQELDSVASESLAGISMCVVIFVESVTPASILEFVMSLLVLESMSVIETLVFWSVSTSVKLGLAVFRLVTSVSAWASLEDPSESTGLMDTKRDSSVKVSVVSSPSPLDDVHVVVEVDSRTICSSYLVFIYAKVSCLILSVISST